MAQSIKFIGEIISKLDRLNPLEDRGMNLFGESGSMFSQDRSEEAEVWGVRRSCTYRVFSNENATEILDKKLPSDQDILIGNAAELREVAIAAILKTINIEPESANVFKTGLGCTSADNVEIIVTSDWVFAVQSDWMYSDYDYSCLFVISYFVVLRKFMG